MVGSIQGLSRVGGIDPFDAFSVEFDHAVRAPELDGVQDIRERSFGETLQHALTEVDESKVAAERITLDFAAGKPVDVHTMMLAVAKSDVLMQVTSTVVSKAATSINQLLQTQI
jgi:flagellar hook-basal body complex protein FliE